MNYFTSTTLNPLFSEEKIAAQKRLFDKAMNQQIATNEELSKIREEETSKIKKPITMKIELSEDYKIAILAHCTALVRRINIQENYQKMIESNIAILNGKTISEIEQQFYDNKKEESPWEKNVDVKRVYKSWLKSRTELINAKS